MRIAILDLGTNVFNLLLGEVDKNGEYRKVKEKKIPAKIGEGIENGSLNEDAFLRAISSLDILINEAKDEKSPDFIIAYATSAIREAKNGKDFINNLEAKYGFPFVIISGEREAELIYKGVKSSMPSFDETSIIMDIGGGSNEFIISRANDILWKKSFTLGMARLKNQFLPSNPIEHRELISVESYCRQELKDLWVAIREYEPKILIGTSGSFDTFRDLLLKGEDNGDLYMEINQDSLKYLHQTLLASAYEERMEMPGMSKIRVDYIVLASIFTQLILKNAKIDKIFQSSYSLKEGGMIEEVEKYIG